jgi:hypothetical protein
MECLYAVVPGGDYSGIRLGDDYKMHLSSLGTKVRRGPGRNRNGRARVMTAYMLTRARTDVSDGFRVKLEPVGEGDHVVVSHSYPS